MRFFVTIILSLLVTFSFSSVASAQFGGFLKKKLEETIQQESSEQIGNLINLNLPCALSGGQDVMTHCLQAGLTTAIAGSLGQYLSNDDQNTHQETVTDTIHTGEDNTWSNERTGTSGRSRVVNEETNTRDEKVVVLKDKVETVPELDLIGENYETKNGVNVRSGPSTEYKVVGDLEVGDVVSVVGKVKDSNWYMISQGGVGSGFVSEDFLIAAPTAVASNTEKPEGDLEEVETNVSQTCKTIEQSVTLDDGSTKIETIKACQGPNGWEIA